VCAFALSIPSNLATHTVSPRPLGGQEFSLARVTISRGDTTRARAHVNAYQRAAARGTAHTACVVAAVGLPGGANVWVVDPRPALLPRPPLLLDLIYRHVHHSYWGRDGQH
jgi:hypothetical protein